MPRDRTIAVVRQEINAENAGAIGICNAVDPLGRDNNRARTSKSRTDVAIEEEVRTQRKVR